MKKRMQRKASVTRGKDEPEVRSRSESKRYFLTGTTNAKKRKERTKRGSQRAVAESRA
jgi:hypothetical protein